MHVQKIIEICNDQNFIALNVIYVSTGGKIMKLQISDVCCVSFKHVTMEDSYLCGYLKIKGLTEVKI